MYHRKLKIVFVHSNNGSVRGGHREGGAGLLDYSLKSHLRTAYCAVSINLPFL